MTTEQPNDSRMALLYLVAKELNEGLNLDQILRRVLIATVRIAGASNGSFFIFNKRGNLAGALFVNGATIINAPKEIVRGMLRKGVPGWVKQNKEAVLVKNAAAETRWQADKCAPDSSTPQSLISVPLITGKDVLGVLTITHENGSYFDTGDLTLLIAIAEQATTVILKARLYQTEQEQHKLTHVLADSFKQMNNIHNLDDLLALILNHLALLIKYDQCLIFLQNKGYLTLVAAKGVDNLAEMQHMPIDLYEDDFAGPILNHYEPVLTADLQEENTWFKSVTDMDTRSWIGLPLVAGESLLGVIAVSSHLPDLYTHKDVHTISTFAGQSAVAIKNARLLNQLQDAQRRYAQLFEESSDLLLIMNPDGFIMDANRKACQLLRRPKDALIGSHLALFGPNLKEIFQQQYLKLSIKREITTELSINDAYGQALTLEINAKQVEIDDNVAIQWAGRDVTARQKLAMLRQDLTNMIVHDLRGPMGTLMGSVQMLSLMLEEIKDPDTLKEAMGLINIANRSGQYLKDLIDSVLDISRLEQGNTPLAITTTPLGAIFSAVEEQTAPQAQAKKIHLTFPPVAEDLTINLDQNMIRRVLVNLIDNAIKYTPASSAITVSTDLTVEKLTISVADNGPGIPPENQKHLFDKFTRATADATIQGVGLGLAFCKLAIDAHHGQIWLESEVGVGSTFIFSIPRNLL